MTNTVGFRMLDLAEGEKYTLVWYDSLTGIVSANVKLVDFYVDTFAQYENSLFLEVIIGRRRSMQSLVFTPNESILIIKGTHKINFDSLYTIEEHDGVTHKYSNVLSMSSEWIKAAREQVEDQDVICYQF